MSDALFDMPAPTLGPCAWSTPDHPCGPVIGHVELEPATHGIDPVHRITVPKKPAKLAAVCREHSDILDRQPRYYSCGCYYEPGEDKCERHHKSLARQGRFIPL